jgi:hypothetical protein
MTNSLILLILSIFILIIIIYCNLCSDKDKLKNIIKTAKQHRILNILKTDNIHNGLSRIDSFNLEKKCLDRINSNFRCICGLKCSHFPKIIKQYPEKYKFLLSNCGYSLNNYNSLVNSKKIKPIIIENSKFYISDKKKYIIVKKIEQQIDCIIYNLNKANVKHLDMTDCGKNLCINNNGIISLIDFDLAVIDNDYKSLQLKKRIQNEYGNNNYNKVFKEKMINIIKKTVQN